MGRRRRKMVPKITPRKLPKFLKCPMCGSPTLSYRIMKFDIVKDIVILQYAITGQRKYRTLRRALAAVPPHMSLKSRAEFNCECGFAWHTEEIKNWEEPIDVYQRCVDSV